MKNKFLSQVKCKLMQPLEKFSDDFVGYYTIPICYGGQPYNMPFIYYTSGQCSFDRIGSCIMCNFGRCEPIDDSIVIDRVGQLITNGVAEGTDVYEALLSAAADDNTTIRHAKAGEVIAIDDGVRLEVLNPTGGQWSVGSDRNEQSVVLRLVYGDFSLLLTGDVGEATEKEMIGSGRGFSALVYKAGHHGARTSSSSEFLETVRPQYVVISSGEENRFGHPHYEMLQRVADVGAAVLRSDELGTIELITDGEQMWMESQQ